MTWEKGVIPSLIFCLFLLSFVSAQPFVQDVRLIEGYDIKYPQNGILEINKNYTFFFHVFNMSDGMPVGVTDTNCSFHLYNETGEHAIDFGNIVNDGTHGVINEWGILVTGGNFTKTGDYSYIVQCNSSVLGGYENVGFSVTTTGYEITTGNAILIFLSVLLFFILGTLLFTGSFKVKKIQIKWTFILGSFIFFLAGLNLISALIPDALINSNVVRFFDSFTAISFIMFWFAFGLIAIMWILTFLQTWFYKKNLKNMQRVGAETKYG